MTENKQKFTAEEIQHQRNIVSAAYTYHNLNWITLTALARSFKVSKSTISQWICEAISRGFIADYKMCEAIQKKHIAEYEASIKSESSCLRAMYLNAFAARKANLGRVDLSALVGASA